MHSGLFSSMLLAVIAHAVDRLLTVVAELQEQGICKAHRHAIFCRETSKAHTHAKLVKRCSSSNAPLPVLPVVQASAIGKNMTNAKTFLEKRYSDEMGLEDAVHTALLTLKEGFEGQVSGSNIEVRLT